LSAVAAAQAHPNVLGALSALNDLADQYQWLADLLEPGTPDRRSRHVTPAARAVAARQHRAERTDLAETLRHGHAPSAPSAAPLSMRVLYAQVAAAEAVTDAAWTVSSALRRRPMLAYVPAAGGDGRRFGRAVEYLQVGLRLIDATLAGMLGTDLNAAAQLAAQATGAAPVRQDFGHGACPACGRRSLVAQTISTADPAIITCTRPDCRCRGVDCLCRRPLRTTGLRHIWPSDEFGQLRAVLDRQQVAA
jgi:hypothetical protein